MSMTIRALYPTHIHLHGLLNAHVVVKPRLLATLFSGPYEECLLESTSMLLHTSKDELTVTERTQIGQRLFHTRRVIADSHLDS